MEANYPQKQGLDFILKKAFYYWNKTLLYQLLFSLTYFSIFILVYYFVALRYGILDELMTIVNNNAGDFKTMQLEMQKIVQKPEYYNLSLAIIFAMTFLFPLNIGFYQIFRKIDLKEQYGLEDLFSGYNGINFFKFSSFFLFWIFVYQYSMLLVFPAIIWVFLTLFSAPLMFFMDKRIFETISLNVKALKLYPLEIFVCVLVAIAFRYFGIFLFLFGFLLTFPFWNAMIYALYQKIFKEVN